MKKVKTDLIMELQEICHELGWAIAIRDDENVEGFIIGTIPFIEQIATQLEDVERYDIMIKENATDKDKLH